MYPCFMSSLVKFVAPLSLYLSSSSVGITCLVRLIAVLAVVNVHAKLCRIRFWGQHYIGYPLSWSLYWLYDVGVL